MGRVDEQQILVKPEATYATDSVPTSANAIRAIDWMSTPNSTPFHANARTSRAVALRGQFYGERWIQHTGSSWWVSYGAAMDAVTKFPESHALFTACGLKATYDGVGQTWTYVFDKLGANTGGTDVATNKGSVTIRNEQAGALFRSTGCRGDLQIALPLGQPGLNTWTMSGMYRYDGASDANNSIGSVAQTALTDSNYSTAIPRNIQVTTFDPWNDGLVAGDLGQISNVVINFRNMVQPHRGHNGPIGVDGMHAFMIEGQGADDKDVGPEITFTVTQPNTSPAIWMDRWQDRTLASGGSLTLGIGRPAGAAVAGHSSTITFGGLYVKGPPTPTKVNNLFAYDVTCGVLGTSGGSDNDSITIVFE